MRNVYLCLILFIFLFNLGCTGEQNDIKKADSVIVEGALVPINGDSIAEDSEIDEESDSEAEYDETELHFIVSVAEGYNYDSLKNIALRTSNILKFKYDSLGRYYHPKKGRVVLPDNDEDEMWAGDYFLRRQGDNFVSIEMRNAYADTSLVNNQEAMDKFNVDTTRMFVFAMMYPDKESADSLAKILKKEFPSTRIIPAVVFMGCMH